MAQARSSNGRFAKGSGKTAKPAPVANPEMAKAMRDLRSSGAAGIHQDQRDKRARTRSAALRRAVEDQGN